MLGSAARAVRLVLIAATLGAFAGLATPPTFTLAPNPGGVPVAVR